DVTDRGLLDQAVASLDATLAAERRQGDLRKDMLTNRQKNLFQARPAFENALKTLMNEVAAGGAMRSGMDAVREGMSVAAATGDHPGMQDIAAYQLEMSRVLASAIMFMATANGSAANDVRDAASTAGKSMAALLASETPDAVKADARVVDTLGHGIGQAALSLIDQTRQLEGMTNGEVAQANQAMRQTIDAVVAVLMAIMGTFIASLIAGPISRLTRSVRAIADGQTETTVAGIEGRDEVGQMAKAVEQLRGVMRQAFVQAQMIQEIPVGVMTADGDGDHRIQYLNAEARRIMATIKDHLPVAPDALEGQGLAIFERASGQSLIVTDPAALPHRAHLVLGGETLELQITALHDAHGAYIGP